MLLWHRSCKDFIYLKESNWSKKSINKISCLTPITSHFLLALPVLIYKHMDVTWNEQYDYLEESNLSKKAFKLAKKDVQQYMAFYNFVW
jgi:hypothetical protein